MDKVFKYVSYLEYVFILWGLTLALPEFYLKSPDIISKIGMGTFLVGLGISIKGLRPEHKISKGDIKLFKLKGFSKIYLGYGVLVIIVVMLLGVFFLLIEHFYTNPPKYIVKQIHDLGLGTLALGVGLIGEQKLLYNKYKKYKLQAKN